MLTVSNFNYLDLLEGKILEVYHFRRKIRNVKSDGYSLFEKYLQLGNRTSMGRGEITNGIILRG